MKTSKEAFEGWLTNPVTKAVREYLRAHRARLMEAWANGQEMGLVEQTMAQAYGDLAELKFEDMRQFYEGDDEQDL